MISGTATVAAAGGVGAVAAEGGAPVAAVAGVFDDGEQFAVATTNAAIAAVRNQTLRDISVTPIRPDGTSTLALKV